jgi:hypothetical protein
MKPTVSSASQLESAKQGEGGDRLHRWGVLGYRVLKRVTTGWGVRLNLQPFFRP